MKKILSFLMSFTLLFSLSLFPISANTNLNDNQEITVVSTEINAEEYIVPNSELIGTSLEGKSVLVTHDKVFVDGQDIARVPGTAVAVFIAGILAGYLIDGVLIYTTDYSGGELVAAGIQALNRAYNAYRNMVTAYFANTSKLKSFKTSDGNECVPAPSGTYYNCKF